MIERWLGRVADHLVDIATGLTTMGRTSKRAVVIVGDGLLAIAATWLAFSLRLGEWRLLDWPVVRFAGSVLVLWYPVALVRGVYRAIFRYSGRGAIIGLAATMAIVTVPLVLVYTIGGYHGVPRTMALLQPLIFLMMMASARIIGRYVLVDLVHSHERDGTLRRVLIYGAGRAGKQLAASMTAESSMLLVGFVDDDPEMHGQRLDGTLVASPDRIEEIIRRRDVTDVLLAIPGATLAHRKAIIGRMEGLAVEVKALPPLREFMDGKVTVSSLRPIEVEELLGRDPVGAEDELLRRSVECKRVMVTGAGGSIGSEICRQVFELGAAELILLDASEFALFTIHQELAGRSARAAEPAPALVPVLLNVGNPGALDRAFARHRPETVFHAAAFKHVPLIEENPLAGIANNVFGTLNTALVADAHGVGRFILISTDKAVRPPNVMGATKRICELILQALVDRGSSTIFTMVRFGNVLNSSGSVVPLFRAQLAAGGPLTVTHREVTRYFMTIPEASQLVIQAGGMARGGEVFVLDMGEPVKIWDLARSMITLAGLTVRDAAHPHGDVEIVEKGLRPGEKLYEELLIGENPMATSHPRVMQAREHMVPWPLLEPLLDQLRTAVEAGDTARCRAVLNGLVPTLPLVGETPSSPAQASDKDSQLSLHGPEAAAIPATAHESS